jgi:hypothetical protein
MEFLPKGPARLAWAVLLLENSWLHPHSRFSKLIIQQQRRQNIPGVFVGNYQKLMEEPSKCELFLKF